MTEKAYIVVARGRLKARSQLNSSAQNNSITILVAKTVRIVTVAAGRLTTNIKMVAQWWLTISGPLGYEERETAGFPREV